MELLGTRVACMHACLRRLSCICDSVMITGCFCRFSCFQRITYSTVVIRANSLDGITFFYEVPSKKVALWLLLLADRQSAPPEFPGIDLKVLPCRQLVPDSNTNLSGGSFTDHLLTNSCTELVSAQLGHCFGNL